MGFLKNLVFWAHSHHSFHYLHYGKIHFKISHETGVIYSYLQIVQNYGSGLEGEKIKNNSSCWLKGLETNALVFILTFP